MSTHATNHQSEKKIYFLIYLMFFQNLEKLKKIDFAPLPQFFCKGEGEGYPISTHAKNHQSDSNI